MVTEGKDSFNLELAKPETVAAIRTTVTDKLDNPQVVRQDPDQGIFVIDDTGQSGHSRKTEIKIEIDRQNNSVFLRFIEWFDEVTPRSKPSVLSYEYCVEGDAIKLLLDDLDKPDEYQGPLARTRHNQLKVDCRLLPSADNNEFAISELHAQKVLVAVQKMRIFIE
jgi:hypothetical protein